MIELSAVVITYNEEKNIGRCLTSLVPVADEIVVVDSLSTDRTKEICAQFPKVKFIEHAFEGYVEQKNWALNQASSKYALSLDADECLDADLQKEILRIKAAGPFTAYALNRLTNHCGHWVKYCGWHPDWNIRLIDRTKGSWKGTNPHDAYTMHDEKDVPIKLKKGILLHYSYEKLEDHIGKINHFTSIKANHLFSQGKKGPIWKFTIYPTWVFLKTYIFRGGFRDGYTGFIISKLAAYYTFSTYSKLWDMTQQKNDNN